MFVEANELRYDTVKNTVSAVGDARVYYKGRMLEADQVTYNRNTGRVLAQGHAKLTETDGSVMHGDEFDLTDDFRNGFIESLRADTTDKTFFSSPHTERIEGDTTVFDKGTYTACAACKDNPDKPPLWRVRARRIIHKNDEQMIYYEDAALEFLGLPIAYVPFFSAPDPTVTRKSGILDPHFISKTNLGYGVGIPIFWALAPDYDLTFTPTFLSTAGLSGQRRMAPAARHRLLLHPREWHRPAEQERVRPLALGFRRSVVSRIARKQGPARHRRSVEVRLAVHASDRQIFPQRL